ncbi:MAG: hypothetical protein JNJ57_09445 [Saprospiraceae bacterium]|nr:hypothetical protein [Saprospiraceae bacterium]
MNFQIKHFFYALLIPGFLILFGACQPKCPSCNPGAECVDGECKCEPDRFYYHGKCLELYPDTYLATSNDCYCYDTILFDIRKIEDKHYFRFWGVSNLVPTDVSIDDGEILYFEKPDGDSLFVSFLTQRCPYPDPNISYTRPRILGKKQPDGSWKLRINFHDNVAAGPVLDSCEVIARKIN